MSFCVWGKFLFMEFFAAKETENNNEYCQQYTKQDTYDGVERGGKISSGVGICKHRYSVRKKP